MEPIYAVSLSIGQSGAKSDARAFLSVRNDDRAVMIRMEWQDLPKVQVQGSPGDWLYGVLGRLLMAYDEHEVMTVEIDGVDQMTEDVEA